VAILRIKEIRDMNPEEREEQLSDLINELIQQRGIISAGGAPENPGRIREIRRAIARLKTVQNEEARTE
jgi:large subunit ribosomal protein L29